mgnify:CR=1 FL=1
MDVPFYILNTMYMAMETLSAHDEDNRPTATIRFRVNVDNISAMDLMSYESDTVVQMVQIGVDTYHVTLGREDRGRIRLEDVLEISRQELWNLLVESGWPVQISVRTFLHAPSARITVTNLLIGEPTWRVNRYMQTPEYNIADLEAFGVDLIPFAALLAFISVGWLTSIPEINSRADRARLVEGTGRGMNHAYPKIAIVYYDGSRYLNALYIRTNVDRYIVYMETEPGVMPRTGSTMTTVEAQHHVARMYNDGHTVGRVRVNTMLNGNDIFQMSDLVNFSEEQVREEHSRRYQHRLLERVDVPDMPSTPPAA